MAKPSFFHGPHGTLWLERQFCKRQPPHTAYINYLFRRRTAQAQLQPGVTVTTHRTAWWYVFFFVHCPCPKGPGNNTFDTTFAISETSQTCPKWQLPPVIANPSTPETESTPQTQICALRPQIGITQATSNLTCKTQGFHQKRSSRLGEKLAPYQKPCIFPIKLGCLNQHFHNFT